jgi:osmotically-inducible protein OsmY
MGSWRISRANEARFVMPAKNTTILKRSWVPALMVSALGLIGQVAAGQSPEAASGNAMIPATAADAPKEDSSDSGLTKRIRERVMADKSLSADARNVKIIALHGKVTLNGLARTEQERNAIEAKAISVAGIDRVVDEIEIAKTK